MHPIACSVSSLAMGMICARYGALRALLSHFFICLSWFLGFLRRDAMTLSKVKIRPCMHWHFDHMSMF